MPTLSVPIRRGGVLVKVLVRPGVEQVRELQAAGRPVPWPEQVLAYLDTGASGTMMEGGILRRMGLQPQESALVSVLGRDDPSTHAIYEVEVSLADSSVPKRWLPLIVLGGPVFPTGAGAALGRDFLGHVTLTYDGPRRAAELRW
jgi:hypothetical protein